MVTDGPIKRYQITVIVTTTSAVTSSSTTTTAAATTQLLIDRSYMTKTLPSSWATNRELSLMLRIEQVQEEITALEKEAKLEHVEETEELGERGEMADVTRFEWDRLAELCQFDVIMMDPLATNAPTRGVALGYDQLPDVLIEDMPVETLSSNGFIFIWVINAKYTKAFELMKRWGYTYVDSIDWVKQTVNRRLAKGHGYYLQHAKETCLVGKKGEDPPGCRRSVGSDVIFAERRGQSQKPEEIYELIEELVPNGRYLEIFARRNNLRDYWVSIGNEL